MSEQSGEFAQHDAENCCALVSDHDGCCAYLCSMCNGRGRLGCYPDDLGCDCGTCDGYGYCQECSGQGFFNEFGEPCHVGWHEVGAYGTCDWGGCDEAAERFRFSERESAWLPVCPAHREPAAVLSGSSEQVNR